MKRQEIKKGEIVIYNSKEGPKLDVRLEKDTVWLTQKQIAMLFDTQRPAITKHLNNIFRSGELDKNSVSSILEHTAADGKVYKTQFYNLDAIISVGYRVNSKRATQFRIWATKTLKEHLVKGYTINEKRLLQAKNQLQELQSAISFLQEKSKHNLLAGQEQEILNLLANYSKTLTLLEQYDKEKLSLIKKARGRFILKYENTISVIDKIKRALFPKMKRVIYLGKKIAVSLRLFWALFIRPSARKNYIHLWKKKPRIFYTLSSKITPLWMATKGLPHFCSFIFRIETIFFTALPEKRKSMIMP